MKRIFILLLLCLVGVALAQTPQTPQTETINGREVVSSEVIVTYKQGASLAKAVNGHKAKYSIDKEHQLGSHVHRHVMHSTAKTTQQLLDELSKDPDVERVEPNGLLHANTIPNDPQFGCQWGFLNNATYYNSNCYGSDADGQQPDINVVPAWSITTGSTSVVVAVIGTGLDYTLPDFAGNVWSAPAQFTVNVGGTNLTCPAGTHGLDVSTTPATCDPQECNQCGHETHVSSQIGAKGNNGSLITGVNWSTTILPLKIYTAANRATDAAAIEAIDAMNQLKEQGVNIRVNNNSWSEGSGVAGPLAMHDEFATAGTNNILVVVGPCNSGNNLDAAGQADYPASWGVASPQDGKTQLTNMIGVTGIAAGGAASSFCYGAQSTQVAAPGVQLLGLLAHNSPYYGGGFTFTPNAYTAYLSGNSGAAPIVAGEAALILSAHPTLTTAQLKSVIIGNTTPLTSPTMTGKTASGGIINVYAALVAAGRSGTTSTTLLATPNLLVMGGTTALTASVSSTTSGTITGTVTFKMGSATLGTASISSGTATLSNVTVNTANGFSVGSDSITASYSGDADFGTSSGSTTLTVESLAVTITTASATPNLLVMGGTTALTASVSSTTSGTITGTVTFKMGSATLGTASISSGTATLSNVTVNAAN
jgi:serine protease